MLFQAIGGPLVVSANYASGKTLYFKPGIY